MKLFIYVEGQEEELFVNRVLRGYLHQFGVIVQKPILAATSFRIGGDGEQEITVGGVTNYESIRQDILSLLVNGTIGPDDVLTSFVDLYALPSSFPGYDRAAALAGGERAECIEVAWKANIGHQNFFPYIQVHEFEALILARPSALENYYPEYLVGIEQLRNECQVFTTAEEINGAKATSPSHRILNHIPAYRKIDGFRHLQDIGVPEIKVHCPRFRAWIERCERRFR